MNVFEQLINKKTKLALVGLGYVGMPIAVAFAKKGLKVIGFDLNREKIELYKSGIDRKQFPELDIRWDLEGDAVNLELWKYDPRLFAKNDIVDPVSLAMCFEDNVDERIEGSLEDYLEEYKW